MFPFMQPLICRSSNHRITETQNWGWMDFWSSPGPNSQLSHGQLQEGSVATWTKQGFYSTQMETIQPLWATGFNGLAILQVFDPSHCPPVSLWDGFAVDVKSCFKVKVNYIHYTPLIHQASCFIIEIYQAG